MTPSVDQNQRAVGAQVAQVEQVEAGIADAGAVPEVSREVIEPTSAGIEVR
jgi:predicted kinase